MEAIMAVAIMRRDLSVGELRREAAGTRDAKAARRMLAIAFVLEGQSRQDAAEICGMGRQTLRDWVHHYNADGLAGLVNRVRRNGPRPHLSPEQEAVVVEWVEQGPDLARDGVVRWRCIDLQDRIGREWGVHLHERTGDRRKIGGQAAIAIGGYGSLAGWNFCPKPEPSVPL